MTASPPSPATQDVVRKPERSLRAAGLSLGYDDRVIVDSIEVALPPGRVTVIVGANACGKSTLLRGMARLLPARGGAVLLDGKDIRSLPGRELAKIVGILPQNPIAPEGITVADLVGRGRYPHQGWFGRPSAEDNRIVAEAMAQTAVAELGERRVSELSGGQRQRVWIAMAIAQDADVLLLDEPTTFLDIAHQVEVLDLLTELNRERGTTVAMVLHDLNLAARYADELIVMANGRIVAQGAPAEVLSTDVLLEAFSLRAQLIDDPVSHTPLIVPLGRFHS